MKDFFLFRKMFTPVFIETIFIIGVLYSLYQGVMDIIQIGIFIGIWTIIVGIIVSRVSCELVMVLFRINDNLSEIRNKNK